IHADGVALAVPEEFLPDALAFLEGGRWVGHQVPCRKDGVAAGREPGDLEVVIAQFWQQGGQYCFDAEAAPELGVVDVVLESPAHVPQLGNDSIDPIRV